MMNDYRHTTITAGLAALQALLISWAVTVLCAVFVYTINAASPVMVDARWQDAATVGSKFWLLSLGGAAALSTGMVTLAPLGFTALILWLYWHFLGKRRITSWWQVAVPTLVAGALILGFSFIGSSGGVQLRGPVIGAALIGASTLAQWWTYDAPGWRIVPMLRPARALVVPVAAFSAIFAAILCAVSVVLSWSVISQINGYYLINLVSTVIFAIVQLLYLPNILVWTLAYGSGAGFAVGQGTSFSSVGVTSAPLPAVPLLGALPSPGTAMPWLIAMLLVIGLGVGAHAAGRFLRLSTALRSGLIALAGIFVGALALGFLSSGAIGSGRMAHVGVIPAFFALIVAVELGGGVTLGLVLGNGRTVAWGKERWYALRSVTAPSRGGTEPGEESAGKEISDSGDTLNGAGTESTTAPTAATADVALAAAHGDTHGDDGALSEGVAAPDNSGAKNAATKPTPLASYRRRFARNPIAPPAAPTAATAPVVSADFIPTAATAFSPERPDDASQGADDADQGADDADQGADDADQGAGDQGEEQNPRTAS
ncbi:MAG: DUF6350 family protein [Ancrocorticia sp.]|jgi:hypothetical protein|nr:DUF6350 family protein [Ancrocorticia sp.]